MSFSEEMFALLKTDDWQACHRRIDEEEPGNDQQTSILDRTLALGGV